MTFAPTESKRRNCYIRWKLIRLVVLSAAVFLAFAVSVIAVVWQAAHAHR
jgi:type II secretory pathway component PulL